MDVRPSIALMERELHKRGLSAAALCRRADIAATTWVRWKAGTPAQGRTWGKVRAAFDQMVPNSTLVLTEAA